MAHNTHRIAHVRMQGWGAHQVVQHSIHNGSEGEPPPSRCRLQLIHGCSHLLPECVQRCDKGAQRHRILERAHDRPVIKHRDVADCWRSCLNVPETYLHAHTHVTCPGYERCPCADRI